MPNAKGTIYLAARLYTERTFGDAAVSRCLDELPPAERQVLDGITAVGWYPVEPFLNYLRALERLYGKGDLKLCEKVGEFSAEWSINTILKFFLRLKSPTWVIEKNQSTWNRFYDSGRWEVSKRQEGLVIGKLFDFDLADAVFCARFRGWLRRALQMTGAKEPKVEEIQCKARGSNHCEFRITWS